MRRGSVFAEEVGEEGVSAGRAPFESLRMALGARTLREPQDGVLLPHPGPLPVGEGTLSGSAEDWVAVFAVARVGGCGYPVTGCARISVHAYAEAPGLVRTGMSEERHTVTEETPAGVQGPTPEELLERLRVRVADTPADWRHALVETMAQWPLAEESVQGRRHVYLIGGEAFDWRALAERLMEACCEKVSADEREEMLTGTGLPAGMAEDELKRALGVEKYRAHLNYVYGVTVEQALQVAVQEEICKRHVGNGYRPGETECEGAYDRLYGKRLVELWAEFRGEVPGSLNGGDGTGADAVADDGAVSPCVADGDAFAYWLFKRRLERADPARVASDTRKGLKQLDKIRRSHERRLRLG